MILVKVSMVYIERHVLGQAGAQHFSAVCPLLLDQVL